MDEHERFILDARQMLIYEEGIERKPYRCPSGKLTIGIGHNLDDQELSDRSIEILFLEDVTKALEGAENVFGPMFEGFDHVRQLAILNMIFQMGTKGFTDFIKTVRLMKLRQWTEAAAEMLNSKWAKQTPARAQRVASMIRHGTWPYKG